MCLVNKELAIINAKTNKLQVDNLNWKQMIV